MSVYGEVADSRCRACKHDATQHNGPSGNTCAQCMPDGVSCDEHPLVITRADIATLKEEKERLQSGLDMAKMDVRSAEAERDAAVKLLRRVWGQDSRTDDWDTADGGGVEGPSEAFEAEVEAFLKDHAE